MRAIYLDCFSGISGNMLLGAFLQAGVPVTYLEQELRKLPMADEFKLQVHDVVKNGIRAVYVDVKLCCGEAEQPHEPHEHGTHAHIHVHAFVPEQVGRQEEAPPQEMEAPGHRTFAEIRAAIEGSSLDAEVKKHSLRIFAALAEAEGKVHGKASDEVVFHEVGAVDSIVDIVGTAICLEYLGVDCIFVSRVNTGSGFVECAHGTMMVPAPATAELLKGFPSYHRGAEKELTTPTGAAVLKVLAAYKESLPMDFVVENIAYGAGTWDLEIPNVLRMYLGEYQGQQESKRYLLETNIDDMNPQIYGYLYERLFEAGALDVWTTGIYMKKNRPAVMLTVLVDEICKEACAEIIFMETTSIGLRVLPVESRIEAERQTARVQTKYGEVSAKVSAFRGKIVSVSVEYEECRQRAREHGVPLKVVQQEAMREMSRRLGD